MTSEIENRPPTQRADISDDVCPDSADVKSLVAGRIQFLERAMHDSEQRTRDLAKAHKKRLRDIQKLVADTSKPSESIIDELQQRTLTALADLWRLQKRVPDLEAEVGQLNRQMQQQTEDLKKGVSVRDRLQDLCRELQQQNKQILKDGQALQAKEAAHRQEMIANFNAGVNNVSERLNEQADVIKKQGEENEMLQTKLQQSFEAIAKTEEHMQRKDKVYELEKQLLEAKLKQQEELAERATERAELLTQHVKAVLEENELLKREMQRKADVLEEHQSTLQQTTEVFKMFKDEKNALTTRVKELEDYKGVLKQQYDRAAQMLLDRTSECQTLKSTNTKLGLANTRLQALCRALRGSDGEKADTGTGGGDGVCSAARDKASSRSDEEAASSGVVEEQGNECAGTCAGASVASDEGVPH